MHYAALPAHPCLPQGPHFLFCVRDESPDRSVWELRVTAAPLSRPPASALFFQLAPFPPVSVFSSLYCCCLAARVCWFLSSSYPHSSFHFWVLLLAAIFFQPLTLPHLSHLEQRAFSGAPLP